MVEKKEFVVIFAAEDLTDDITEFKPIRVIEGKYNKEENWFSDLSDGIIYIHLDFLKNKQLGYGCRTAVELIADSIKKESIEQIKNEILEYAKQYTYIRNFATNGCIVTINKETGEERLYEDIDNMFDYQNENIKKSSSLNTCGKDILTSTPFEIEEEIRKTIKGQDESIRKIVTALWTTMNFREMRKKNMLIVGSSGVGKTAIFEKIKEILDIPVIIFPVPGLSQAGYVGRSTDEILKQAYYDSEGDIDRAEKAIIILDELDKIATGSNGNGDISTTGVQNELLKIIEGSVRYIESLNQSEPSFTIDTSEMIFVGTGAFQELFEKQKRPVGYNQQDKQEDKITINTEKLINYGLKRELVGRLPILVQLNNLGKKELKDIIINSNESELTTTIESLRKLDVEIKNINEVIDIIVEDALKKEIGARGLVLTLNNMFQEIFYQIGNNPNKYSKVIIGKDIINNPYDFQLIKRRNKTKKLEK